LWYSRTFELLPSYEFVGKADSNPRPPPPTPSSPLVTMPVHISPHNHVFFMLLPGTTKCRHGPPTMASITDAPDEPAPPAVSNTTARTTTLSWSPVAGNALAVLHYTVKVQEVGKAVGPMMVQCPGGQVPVRTDDGPMSLQDW